MNTLFSWVNNNISTLISRLDAFILQSNRKYTSIHIENNDLEDCVSQIYLYGIENTHVVVIYGSKTTYCLLAIYAVNDIETGQTKINYFVPANLDFFHNVITENKWCYNYRKTCRRIIRSIDDWNIYDIVHLSIENVMDKIKSAVK